MPETRELHAWLSLFHTPELGNHRFSQLLARFGSAMAIVSADACSLRELCLPAGTVNAILSCTSPGNAGHDKASADLDWQQQEPGRTILIRSDPRYPELLGKTEGAPPLLYVRGNPDALLRPQLAIVGSRAASRYGREVASRLASDLAAAGFAICSGLASGIDTAAHAAVVQLGACTTAVLGNGLDTIYPTANAGLARRIEEQGALVSEFPRDHAPRRAYFPQRNRVISGLSLGVIVVEATLRSGSLITARYALEQNREVFAVPGSVNNPKSRGCHRLLREGAHLLETVDDVLGEIGSMVQYQLQGLGRSPSGSTLEATLGAEEKTVLAMLDEDPVSIDRLLQLIGMRAEQLLPALLELEMRGLVECAAGGYRRC